MSEHEMKVITIPLNNLQKHPSQPRFDESENIEELKQSIQEYGLISMPIISSHPTIADKFYIVAGHRRVRAMRELGYTSTNAILTDNDYKDTITPLAENTVRKELSFMELSAAIYKIKQMHGDITMRAISQIVGKTETFTSTACRVGSLDKEIIDKLYEYKNYKFANSEKICNRLYAYRQIRTKNATLKLIEKLKNKEEKDKFHRDTFYQFVVKEIKLSTKKIREKGVDTLPNDEEKYNANTDNKIQEENEFDPFDDFSKKVNNNTQNKDKQKQDTEEKNQLTVDNNIRISDLAQKKGDGFKIQYDKNWTEIKLYVNVNNITLSSSHDIQYYLKKIEEKIR